MVIWIFLAAVMPWFYYFLMRTVKPQRLVRIFAGVLVGGFAVELIVVVPIIFIGLWVPLAVNILSVAIVVYMSRKRFTIHKHIVGLFNDSDRSPYIGDADQLTALLVLLAANYSGTKVIVAVSGKNKDAVNLWLDEKLLGELRVNGDAVALLTSVYHAYPLEITDLIRDYSKLVFVRRYWQVWLVRPGQSDT